MVDKMKLAVAAAAAALLGSQAQASHAGYVTATYSGAINTIYDGSSFYDGEPIAYSVTFAPSKLVDYTSSTNATLAKFSNPISYNSVIAASLSDDPRAALSIRLGNQAFSKFDQVNYGTPTSDTHINLGTGNFPIVEYLNGSFAGAGGVFYNAGNTALFTDPIAAARGAFDGHGFYVYDDTSDAEGDYNIGAAVFTAGVPEPAAWVMMVGGLGLVGATLRRTRRMELA